MVSQRDMVALKRLTLSGVSNDTGAHINNSI